MEIIEKALEMYLSNLQTNNEENSDNEDIDDYFGFTNFEELNTQDDKIDKTEEYELVCGIKIETNYCQNTKKEQLNLYDVGIGHTFDMNGMVEIKNISENQVVLRIDDSIELNRADNAEQSEENNKIDYTIKVNRIIGGFSKETIPTFVLYTIKVLYVRKKRKKSNRYKY